MRIFPEGAREWLTPTGQVFMLLSAGMALLAIVTFGWKSWMLTRWPRTDGFIVSARMKDSQSDNRVRLCSAVYRVRYAVGGQDFVTEIGGHSFVDDCPGVEAAVSAAPGKKVVALYDKHNPRGAYVDPRFDLDFFLAPFILTVMSAAFGVAGLAAWKLGRWMER